MFKRLLIIMLVFFAVGLQVVFAQQRGENRRAGKKGGPVKVSSGKGPGQILRDEELRSELNLSEEQRAQIQLILEDSREQIRNIHRTAEQNIKEIKEKTINDVSMLLTLEQGEKLTNKNKGEELFPESQAALSESPLEKSAETENGEIEEETGEEETLE